MCTINVAGSDRQYFLALPANYNANTAYPLVFAWHGATHYARELLDSGRSQTDRGFFRVRENFPEAIYVAAQGLVGDPGNVTGWPNTNGRDVAFTRAMIASFESNYCVDRNRIFSTGASYGGMMTALLGCQMPDVFRGLAVLLGSLNGRNNCVARPIAAWFEHGDADMTVNISGGMSARDYFIQRNGCSTTNTQTMAMSDGRTTCTIYNSCTSGNHPVVWCPVPGMGHSLAPWTGMEIAKFFRQF
jgi:polyhydroxybutyrate depolymerase